MVKYPPGMVANPVLNPDLRFQSSFKPVKRARTSKFEFFKSEVKNSKKLTNDNGCGDSIWNTERTNGNG